LKLSWNDKRRLRQRISPLWKKLWPPVQKQLEHRMAEGHREYGDRSFNRPMFNLLNEAEEEILDQMIWSFIALTRLGDLRDRIQRLEERLNFEEMKQLIEETTEEIPHIDSSE